MQKQTACEYIIVIISSDYRPKNNVGVWAAATRKIQAPSTIMIFFENLLSECKTLIINTPQNPKQPKETNWKQRFQKPQNENICFANLNVENNGYFPILGFREQLLESSNSR